MHALDAGPTRVEDEGFPKEMNERRKRVMHNEFKSEWLLIHYLYSHARYLYPISEGTTKLHLNQRYKGIFPRQPEAKRTIDTSSSTM